MKIYSQGDQAIVVAIEKEVSKNITEDLLTLRSYLLDQHYPFITEIVPSESEMMICYNARDMMKHHHIQSPYLYMKSLMESISKEVKRESTSQLDQQKSIMVPIIYGGEFGPDLNQLLQYYQMEEETFKTLHANNHYFVSMMGYSPGFPYLTGLNSKLYINHTCDEKKFIPAGSVIIEGKKCGIVTTDTYNDWLVIGYTPYQLFNPQNEKFSLLNLGDSVTFQPITESEIKLGALEDVNHN